MTHYMIMHNGITIEDTDQATDRKAINYAKKRYSGKVDVVNVEQAVLIAEEFGRELGEYLTAKEKAAVIIRNSGQTDRGAKYSVCHSHDFCDANMAMDAAYKKVMKKQINANDESQLVYWNTAWNIAKHHNFYWEI